MIDLWDHIVREFKIWLIFGAPILVCSLLTLGWLWWAEKKNKENKNQPNNALQNASLLDLVKEYILRKDDFEYVYSQHGKRGVHYSKDSRYDVSNRLETAEKTLKEAAPGMIEVLHRLSKESRNKKLEQEVNEWRASFDLYHKAEIRAIEMWKEAGGDPRVWPDKARLTIWLLEQLDKKDKQIEELKQRGKWADLCEGRNAKNEQTET